MALELEGKITRKLDVQRGTSARGAWFRQDFVLEYKEGNYPTNACLSVWGEDKVRDLEKFQVGDVVKVSFNLSSREYNGRWYTEARAWRIVPAAPAPEFNGNGAPMPTADDLPAYDSGSSDNEDLPF